MLLVAFLPLLALGAKARSVPRWSHPVGAAYWITDETGAGNNVIAAAISPQGTLSSAVATHAGGLGSHGQVAGDVGGDPFFSQGPVQVSGRNLYTINAGSNTVVRFSIDPYNATHLTMVGKPVSSGGEFPISLAVSKKTGTVCVLNGGAKSNVNCFLPHSQNGLAPISGTLRTLPLNQTTPPLGPPGTASHIIFNEDEKKLIVSVKGTPPAPGYLAIWDVSVNHGVLGLSKSYKKVLPPTGGGLPFSLTIVPNSKNVFLNTDPAVGFTIFDLEDKAKSSAVAIPGQKANCWSVYSKKTGNYYLSDTATGIINEVAISKSLKGRLVKQHHLLGTSAPTDSAIATIGGKEYLYVLTAGDRVSVSVFSLPASGEVVRIQKYNEDTSAPVSRFNLAGMALYIAP